MIKKLLKTILNMILSLFLVGILFTGAGKAVLFFNEYRAQKAETEEVFGENPAENLLEDLSGDFSESPAENSEDVSINSTTAAPWESGLTAYEQLSEEEQRVYDQIAAGIEAYEESISIKPSVSEAVLKKSAECVFIDHPEYFWYENQYVYWTSSLTGKVSDFEPTYSMTEGEKDAIALEIQEELDGFRQGIPEGASDYEKAKAAYEFVIFSTEYAEGSSYNQSVVSVFLNKKTVCAGYAKAMQYLLHELDIPCAYVTGMAASGDGNADSHAWNVVKLDQDYYYIDATWGDPVPSETGEKLEIEYAYLCGSPQMLEASHVMDIPIEMPACTSDAYDYYKMNHLYYDTYDAAEIESQLIRMAENGEVSQIFVFGSYEASIQCKEDLSDSDMVENAGRIWADRHGQNHWEWSVIYTEKLNKVEFIWTS